jgi:hypothetical protein
MRSKDSRPPRIKKRRISFLGAGLFSAFFLLLFPLSKDAFSWRGQVHTRMTNDALKIMPKMPDDLFRKNAKELRTGALEPDKNKIIKHDDVRDVGMMIETLAKKCEKRIRENEDWAKIMFTLGQTTHYVEDINTPFHCIRVKKEIHEEFEKVAVDGEWHKEKYKGFNHINNYRIFADNICNFSERYVPFIEKWYIKTDPEILKKMMAPLWEHAVQDIADLWLTVLPPYPQGGELI